MLRTGLYPQILSPKSFSVVRFGNTNTITVEQFAGWIQEAAKLIPEDKRGIYFNGQNIGIVRKTNSPEVYELSYHYGAWGPETILVNVKDKKIFLESTKTTWQPHMNALTNLGTGKFREVTDDLLSSHIFATQFNNIPEDFKNTSENRKYLDN